MNTRVLLVEDNEPLAHMLERFLLSQGHEVTLAKTGAEALTMLATREFGLLVLDLRLPEVSGIEVLQRLRKSSKGATMPVIIMTGYYKGGKFAEGAAKLGVRHYLEKPFSQQTFLRATQEALEAAKVPQQSPITILSQLVDLYYSRKSGTLKLRNGISVIFLSGTPVSFISKGREEFTAALAAKGKLTRQDIHNYLKSGEERLFLTVTGNITFEELVSESRNFLAKLIIDSLRGNTIAEFVPEAFEIELPLVPIMLPELLYEAISSQTVGLITDSFLSRFGHLYPARNIMFYRQANLVALSQDDIAALGKIDGNHSMNEVVGTSPSKTGAVALCHFLNIMKMLDFHPNPVTEEIPDLQIKTFYNRPLEETPLEDKSEDFEDLVAEVCETVEIAVGEHGMAAPLSSGEISFEQQVQRDNAFIKDKNYYELMGMTPGYFSFNKLKESYFSRTRPYSQEKLMELSSATLEIAQEVLSVFSTAYNTLSNVVSKERYDELLNAETVGLSGKQDDKLQTEVQFQSGKVFLEMGDYSNAEKALQDAYRLSPEDPLNSAYLAWSIYKNPLNQSSKVAFDRARSLLAKSLQFGKHPEAYAFRGWMLLDEGRDGLAEAEFQKALKLNQRDALSLRGLHKIEERRQAEKKGIFRKFFS